MFRCKSNRNYLLNPPSVCTYVLDKCICYIDLITVFSIKWFHLHLVVRSRGCLDSHITESVLGSGLLYGASGTEILSPLKRPLALFLELEWSALVAQSNACLTGDI